MRIPRLSDGIRLRLPTFRSNIFMLKMIVLVVLLSSLVTCGVHSDMKRRAATTKKHHAQPSSTERKIPSLLPSDVPAAQDQAMATPYPPSHLQALPMAPAKKGIILPPNFDQAPSK